MKYFFLIDTYKSGKRKYPRMSVINENGGGTRLFGAKYGTFPTDKDALQQQITPDMVGTLLCELGVKEGTTEAAIKDIKQEMEKPNAK